MTRIPRLVVGWTVVVALVAMFVGCASSARTAVPTGLLGRWEGGSHSNGQWFYEFSADGGYRTWPARSPGMLNTGTVVVAGTAITFSNGGAPVTSTWSLANGLLVLDGDSYQRA